MEHKTLTRGDGPPAGFVDPSIDNMLGPVSTCSSCSGGHKSKSDLASTRGNRALSPNAETLTGPRNATDIFLGPLTLPTEAEQATRRDSGRFSADVAFNGRVDAASPFGPIGHVQFQDAGEPDDGIDPDDPTPPVPTPVYNPAVPYDPYGDYQDAGKVDCGTEQIIVSDLEDVTILDSLCVAYLLCCDDLTGRTVISKVSAVVCTDYLAKAGVYSRHLTEYAKYYNELAERLGRNEGAYSDDLEIRRRMEWLNSKLSELSTLMTSVAVEFADLCESADRTILNVHSTFSGAEAVGEQQSKTISVQVDALRGSLAVLRAVQRAYSPPASEFLGAALSKYYFGEPSCAKDCQKRVKVLDPVAGASISVEIKESGPFSQEILLEGDVLTPSRTLKLIGYSGTIAVHRKAPSARVSITCEESRR